MRQKGAGGTTNLINRCDDSTLLRWKICCPDELAQLIQEYEKVSGDNSVTNHNVRKHHEDIPAFQNRFYEEMMLLHDRISFRME